MQSGEAVAFAFFMRDDALSGLHFVKQALLMRAGRVARAAVAR